MKLKEKREKEDCRREEREEIEGEKNKKGPQGRRMRGDCRREKREGTAGEEDVRKGENGAGYEVE